MNIEKYRREKKISQKELADAIGVSVSIISRYESGSISPPLKRLNAIADYLGIDTRLLIESNSVDNDLQLQRLQTYSDFLRNDYFKRLLILGCNGHCELCHKKVTDLDDNQFPYMCFHPINLDDAKTDPVKNFVALCPSCNSKFSNNPSEEDQKYLEEAAKHHNF